MTEKDKDPRAQRIFELEREGKTQTEIAEIIGVDRRTVYNIRTGPTYLDIYADTKAKYHEMLDTLSKSEQATIQMMVIQELGRHERSGAKIYAEATLKQMDRGKYGCDDQCPFYVERSTEKSKKLEFFWRHIIQVQPWQNERAVNAGMGRPYEHIDETWKPPASLGDEWRKKKGSSS